MENYFIAPRGKELKLSEELEKKLFDREYYSIIL